MFACEQQVPCERLDLEEGNGWTNDIQIQAVRMPENEIVRMLRREASSVPNGSLMAGGLARVHDRQLSGPDSWVILALESSGPGSTDSKESMSYGTDTLKSSYPTRLPKYWYITEGNCQRYPRHNNDTDNNYKYC